MSKVASYPTRAPREVQRRATIVTVGGGGRERLLPLLATLATSQDTRSVGNGVGGTANGSTENQSIDSKLPEVIEEDDESEDWGSSDEYDTDLELELQADSNNNDGNSNKSTKTQKDPEESPKISRRARRRKSRANLHVPAQDADNSSGARKAAADGAPDNGETAYMEACDRLGITPVQRIINGLSTPVINLKFRSLGPRGAKALAAGLMRNTKVETLDVEENGLGGEGAVYIAEMLRENLFITAVNLAKNNIGSEGALAFGELLQFDNEIQYLDLSENGLRDVDAEPLALGIERNERIIYLNLSHNEFSEEGAVSLGRAIGTNNSIERLDLSWNQTRKRGAVMICTGLKRNYCVTSVNLSWNGFDLEGSLAVGEMLRGNKYLREVDISHNRINWEGAILIAKGLKENDTLEILYMGGNPLSMTGVLDIIEAVDNSISVVSYIGFDGIPVNRKIMYMTESIQKHRQFTISHGGLLESEDIFGRRMVLRCDPLKLLVQFLTDKNIRPVDLFRTFDKDKQFRVTREQFITGLKKAKVPLDDYEMEKVLFRLDTGKEGKISYQRLMKGVKEQLRMNRAEEKQRMQEEKNTNDEHRKLMKMAGLATSGTFTKVSFAGSGYSSSRQEGEADAASTDSLSDDEDALNESTVVQQHGHLQGHRQSNLTKANVQALQATAVRHHAAGSNVKSIGGGSTGVPAGGGSHQQTTGSKSSLASSSVATMSKVSFQGDNVTARPVHQSGAGHDGAQGTLGAHHGTGSRKNFAKVTEEDGTMIDVDAEVSTELTGVSINYDDENATTAAQHVEPEGANNEDDERKAAASGAVAAGERRAGNKKKAASVASSGGASKTNKK